MKKIVSFEWMSLDGFISDRNEGTDWFVWDEEVGEYAKKVQSKAGALLFGRATYEIMAKYWPIASTPAEDPAIIQFMNETSKIVLSKSLDNSHPLVMGWGKTTILNDINAEEIKKLKKQAAGNILIYGSGSIVSQLMKLGLLDEQQVMINPIVLGSGKPLFQNIDEKFKLQLKTVKKFKCGNAILVYQNGASQ